MKRLLVTALCLSVLSGCAFLRELLNSSAVQGAEPTFSFRSMVLTDISLGGLNLDTVWDLKNPNSVAISLASVDYALFIEGKQVLAGAPANGLQIAANGSSELHFPANIKFTDVAAVVETFLTKDTASWRAEGGLGVSTPIGVIRFPIAKQGEFEVPKLPVIVFGNPRVSNIGFQGATVEFPMTVTNKNTYALPIAGVTGSLAIAGSNIGTLSTGNLGAMEGKGAKQVSLPLNISFIGAANAAITAVQGGNAQVTFTAQVQSGGQALPIKVDQLLNFIR
jgi:LEA14-like dessication related protein